MGILRQETCSGLGGVAHGFLGNRKELKDWLDLGFYIAVGVGALGLGMAPMAMPSLSEAVVRAIPDDRLLTETDASGSSLRENLLKNDFLGFMSAVGHQDLEVILLQCIFELTKPCLLIILHRILHHFFLPYEVIIRPL